LNNSGIAIYLYLPFSIRKYANYQVVSLINFVYGPFKVIVRLLKSVFLLLAIFASFNLPPLLAPSLEKRMSEELKKYVSATSIAQFATPAAVQIVSTPLHLLGLDLYNRQSVRWQERMSRVIRDWAKSAFARMGRIIPAFGVGGVVNTKVRKGLMEKLE